MSCKLITNSLVNIMSYLVDTTNLKKKFCNHDFKIIYPNGKKNPCERCIKCLTIRKLTAKNQTLLQFMTSSSANKVLAYKQSILLAGVVALVEKWISTTNWTSIIYDGWKFPATRGKYSWCGLWHTIGCLNYKLHQKLGKGKRVYIKQFAKSCYRASCSVCYVKWIIRDADRAAKRFEKYVEKHPEKRNQKPIHLILLPPHSQHYLGYDKLKDRMMEILGKAQWKGGSVIFHPFAPDKKGKNWEKRPHFHLVGFGTKAKMANAYGMYGWYLKDCGERESLFKTFCYLLSHCGIKKSRHSIIWIGELSYRKLKVEKEKKISCCPICEGKFVPVSHEGVHPIVTSEKNYSGLIDWDDHWHPS